MGAKIDTGSLSRRPTKPHKFVGPGEIEFVAACEQAGITLRYEPYFYDLATVTDINTRGQPYQRTMYGFTPDFLIEATASWPAIHVEITAARRRSGKVRRIIATRTNHNIHTVLLIVDSGRWRKIMSDPKQLRRMLAKAGQRAPAKLAA